MSLESFKMTPVDFQIYMDGKWLSLNKAAISDSINDRDFLLGWLCENRASWILRSLFIANVGAYYRVIPLGCGPEQALYLQGFVNRLAFQVQYDGLICGLADMIMTKEEPNHEPGHA